ncbi:MAG: alpha/beta fold hydrolase [Leptolyngbya sp. SIO4C1]|nr:alpha/beta fold hydrolase [Leptolyngbya sp. SIO4C1]
MTAQLAASTADRSAAKIDSLSSDGAKDGANRDSQTRTQGLPETFLWDWRGYDVSCAVSGSGQPIVLIHGFGASIGHWRKNMPALAAAGYRVYALDLLGFGNSEKPAIDYTLELWQGLLRDFWKAHIQTPAIFVGNSIGGLLALMLLAHYPEMSQAGIVLNCAGSLNHRPEDLPRPLAMGMGLFAKLVKSKLVGPLIFSQVRQKFRIRGALKQVYKNHAAITDELVDLLHAPSCHTGAQQVFASVLTAAPGPRPADLLPAIQQPLLVIWGESDPWTPIQAASLYQQLAQDNTRAVAFRSLPQTGHCPHDERPEVVNALMLDWLAQLSFKLS